MVLERNATAEIKAEIRRGVTLGGFGYLLNVRLIGQRERSRAEAGKTYRLAESVRC